MLKSLKTCKDTLLVWKPSEKPPPPKVSSIEFKKATNPLLTFQRLITDL